MLRPDEEQINTTGINGNGKNRLKKLWSMNRGVGTGEASEARASPEIRAFTIEKF